MKTQLKLIAVAALVLAAALTVQAQPVVGGSLLTPGLIVDSANGSAQNATNGFYPTSLASLTTATNILAIPVPREQLGVEFSGVSDSAGNTNVVITFARSLSTTSVTNSVGSNARIQLLPTWTIAMAGTTRVTASTNIAASGFDTYYVYSIAYGVSVGSLTNYTLRFNNSK